MTNTQIERVDLPDPRYTYGADDYMFVELAEAMSFDANFLAQAITQRIRSRELPGILEVAPANASYLVQFDPTVRDPETLLAELEAIREEIDIREYTWDASVIEIPVFYNDPWTHETLMRFRDRHQAPDSTDLEYCADINGFDSPEEIIDAHSEAPHMATMIGFVPGLAWCFQMVPRDRQLEAPKYKRPRTDTPGRAIGFGGAFTTPYPVQGAGGYQLFGRTPVEVLDVEQSLPQFEESIVLPDPGDILVFSQIDREEYDMIREEVEAGTYEYNIEEIDFVPDEFFEDPDGYNENVMEVIK
jgi:urea carboxylase